MSNFLTPFLYKADVEKIFQEKAVFIGNQDVIPFDAVVELLGKSASELAKRQGDYNEYWIRDKEYMLKYFYKKGFEKAVTYHNIMIIKQSEISNER